MIARNRSRRFFLMSHQLNDSGYRIALDATLEASAGAKAGKTVKITERGFGFHIQDPTACSETCQVFKEPYFEKTIDLSAQKRKLLSFLCTENGEDPE